MAKNKKYIAVISIILLIFIGIVVVLFAKNNLESDISSDQQVIEQEVTVNSTIEQQLEKEDGYVIETDYINLYFPQKWEANLETEIVEEEAYTVQFYGKVEGKDRQKIFDIVFNGDAENMIGVVEVNGENVYVGFNFAEPEIGEDWNVEEADAIYAMQEDVNYLIGMLQKENGFVSDF